MRPTSQNSVAMTLLHDRVAESPRNIQCFDSSLVTGVLPLVLQSKRDYFKIAENIENTMFAHQPHCYKGSFCIS